MDVSAFIDSLRNDPAYMGQIVCEHRIPSRKAVPAPTPEGLSGTACAYLKALGIPRLYSHQAEAIDSTLAGKDTLVTTAAASGKSLCYQVPLVQLLTDDPTATALLLFPTKALARDQVATWNRGIRALPPARGQSLCAVAFDADTGTGSRQRARDSARVLVTNPEMLHAALLPAHPRWARFLQGLRLVVLDEMHVYTGFFGANMANLFRRLYRVCRRYTAITPRLIALSATVGNPREAAELITGRELHHVWRDGSPAGARTFLFWNPPRQKRRRWRGRRSANVEAHELMVRLVRSRIATICFSKARNTAEMIYRYTRESLRREVPGLAERVIPYRGGYSPAERRAMEQGLREGEILGVSTTRALELGIDIGHLDACIIVGYPGLLNAFFQQAGRVGRSGVDSLCILVGIDTPINQFIMHHPELIFGRPLERTVIDRDNPFVVLGHLRCAAAEAPVALPEARDFGYAAPLALEVLEESRKVHRIDERWYHASSESPAHEVRLRGYGDESTVITDADTGRIIDRMDTFRALRLFYPGAIYFHRGDTYSMEKHDTDRNVVLVRRVDVSYYTDPYTGTAVDHIDRTLDTRPLGTGRASLGEVYAVLRTPMYQKVPFYSMDRIALEPIDMPPIAYEAMAFWLTAPEQLARAVARLGLEPGDGMKGILYCLSRILPLFLTSDTNDFDWTLGCRNAPWHTMFWFEFYLQGIGHAEQCYERLEEILALTLEHLLTCDCKDGCPNCTSRLISPYHVRNIELGEGTMHSRRAAVVVLDGLLNGRDPTESLARLDAPRPRGVHHLPTFTLDKRQPHPHRMPLDERTRRLMLRKLERSRHPKERVDHAVEADPPVGIPPVEKEKTLGRADGEMTSGSSKIVTRAPHSARDLHRRLSRLEKLSSGRAETGRRESTAAVSAADTPREPAPGDAESGDAKPGIIGDDVARRAWKLSRQKRKREE